MVRIDELQLHLESRRYPNRPSAHLTADTIAELHAFAKRIGLRRRRFVAHPLYPYYELSKERHAYALKRGAVLVSSHEQARMRRLIRIPSVDDVDEEATSRIPSMGVCRRCNNYVVDCDCCVSCGAAEAGRHEPGCTAMMTTQRMKKPTSDGKASGFRHQASGQNETRADSRQPIVERAVRFRIRGFGRGELRA
jgi:hypothetical protein